MCKFTLPAFHAPAVSAAAKRSALVVEAARSHRVLEIVSRSLKAEQQQRAQTFQQPARPEAVEQVQEFQRAA